LRTTLNKQTTSKRKKEKEKEKEQSLKKQTINSIVFLSFVLGSSLVVINHLLLAAVWGEIWCWRSRTGIQETNLKGRWCRRLLSGGQQSTQSRRGEPSLPQILPYQQAPQIPLRLVRSAATSAPPLMILLGRVD